MALNSHSAIQTPPDRLDFMREQGVGVYDLFQQNRQAKYLHAVLRGRRRGEGETLRISREWPGGVGIGALITTDAKSHFETNA